MTVLDLFAGLGGWELAARELGVDPIGIELDADACATRATVGLRTIRADLERFRIPTELDGLIASPPCQDFSTAGKRIGRTGDRGQLIDLVPLWIERARPRWVACEQVPPCLPIWQEHAERYRRLGYRTWVGILNAADYGVPQTRRRAILLASLDRHVACPPPTHERAPDGMFALAPWVSMADALGWQLPGRVGFPRLDDTGTSPDGYRERDWRPLTEPAAALTEKARSWTLDRRQSGAIVLDPTVVPALAKRVWKAEADGERVPIDELERAGRGRNERWERRTYPLLDLGLTRADCQAIIAGAGLPVPPKSSCYFCPFHSRQTWQVLRRDEPGLFEKAQEIEDAVIAKRAARGKTPMYLTKTGKRLSDAIVEAQDTLPGFNDGPEGCDSGYCFT